MKDTLAIRVLGWLAVQLVAVTAIGQNAFTAYESCCDPYWSGLRATHCSPLSVEVGFLALSKDGFDLQNELRNAAGTQTLLTESLRHRFDGGWRIRASTLLTSDVRGELLYFGVGDWSASSHIAGVSGTSTFDVNTKFEANLQNFETNLIYEATRDATILFGLRGGRYEDSFDLLATIVNPPDPVVTEQFVGDAKNDLFGAQIGFSYGFGVWNWWFDGFYKFALLNNSSTQRGPAYTDFFVVDGTPELRFDNSSDEVTKLSDFGARATWFLHPNWNLQVAYQGLVFDDLIESAPQQGQPAGESRINFHGGYIGLTWLR